MTIPGIPDLAFVRPPQSAGRTGLHRSGPGLGHLVLIRVLRFLAETVLRCGSFPPTQKSFDSDSALLPKLYGITSWVMLRVQDGGGGAATSCFL